MTLRLLSWNDRGLNNPCKREVCKNLLKEWRCDIVCLQETKLSSVNSAVLCSLSGSPFIDWAILDVVQTSGGGFCCFGISGWLRKLMCWLVSSHLVFFLGLFWMGLNGFALAFMVQTQTFIGLLCGRSYRGWVLDGIRLGF